MAGVIADSAADESLHELVDTLEPEIIQHLPEPSRLFRHMDVSIIPFGKLRFLHGVSIAGYAEPCISYGRVVRLSVCPSVCPSVTR